MNVALVGCNWFDRFVVHPELFSRDFGRARARDLNGAGAGAGFFFGLLEAERNSFQQFAPTLYAALMTTIRSIRTHVWRKALTTNGGNDIHDDSFHCLPFSLKDQTALSSGMDGTIPWLDGNVSLGHILDVAQKHEETPSAAYSRIKNYETLFGLKLPEVDMEQLDQLKWTEKDRIALSGNLKGSEPWLDGNVSVGHLLDVAQNNEETPSAAYSRIKNYETLFGLKLPEVDMEQLDQLTWTEKDRIALSRHLDGKAPFLTSISSRHITCVCRYLGDSKEQVRTLLEPFSALGLKFE